MKKTNIFHKLGTFLMTTILSMSLVTTALATDSTIVYNGHNEGFTFAPGSEYTNTDLFDNFKSVMPGDMRSEVVTFKNDYRGSDYVRIWMSALLHDGNGNPISPEVLKKLEADKRKGSMSELEYMHDFLSQLTLTVWNGERTDENIIYTGRPNSLDQGFEGENVYLGRLNKGESLTLNVELSVDIEMGNEYANRIGEVDWIFLIEERNNPSDDPDDRPSGGDDPKPKPDPDDTVIIYPSDVPLAGPENLPAEVLGDYTVLAPKTGDGTVVTPYLILLAVGILGMVLALSEKRKRVKE